MIKYINVGKIVNTHALKGEVRIISDFEFKDRVFIPNNVLYIGQFKDREVNLYLFFVLYDIYINIERILWYYES